MGIMTIGALSENETKFWLPSVEINALFLLDLNKGSKSVVVGRFCDYVKDRAWVITKVISWKNKLFFFSRYSYEMWVGDKDGNNLEHYQYFDGMDSQINNIIMYRDSVWIIPLTLEMPIIVMDLNNRKISQLSWGVTDEMKDTFVVQADQKDNKIFLLTRKGIDVCVANIDCDTKKIDFQKIDQLSYAHCIGFEGEKLYILGISKNSMTVLLKYDLFNGQSCESYELNRVKLQSGVWQEYQYIIGYHDRLFLIPGPSDNLVVYDLQSCSETVLEYPRAVNSDKGWPFRETQQIENILYMFPYSSGYILKLNLQTLELNAIEISVEQGVYDNLMTKYFQEGGIIGESNEHQNVNFESFMRLNQENRERIPQDKSCGKDIYKKIICGC